MKILICDDEVEFLEELTEAAIDRGFTVSSANSFATALKLLSAEAFDAFVTDIRLPGERFDRLVAQLSAMGRNAPAKVIAMTGHADEQTVDAVRMVCGWPVLLKPFSVGDLLSVVQFE
jgi:DNA-binding response OmpR family regulator